MAQPSLILSKASAQGISLAVTAVIQGRIDFSYATPQRNRPREFGNRVCLWRGDGPSVPWHQTPERTVKLTSDDASGRGSLDGIDLLCSGYWLGYAVGPAIEGDVWSPHANLVALCRIPCQAANPPPPVERFAVNATLVDLAPSRLIFRYTFLPGFDAASSGAWAGLWNASEDPYGQGPGWRVALAQPGHAGTVAMDGMRLEPGGSYILGLYPTGFGELSPDDGCFYLAARTSFSV